MSKPMENKSSGMKQAIENLFPGTKAAIEQKKCPVCKNSIAEFRDSISYKEYMISGMCQECQDSVFGDGEAA